ncbi:DUF3265 domain-containing protein [Vibrio parahaemolyticus]|nr:DUF3265 domain-containing protein [Vibrio parahaemolyticus]TOD82990.1 DUF3265 domain-containing protein [Vibrio parahaemolyticus]
MRRCSKSYNNLFKSDLHAWYFYVALLLPFKVVCGSFGVALLTPSQGVRCRLSFATLK